jgi:hypothetical protein
MAPRQTVGRRFVALTAYPSKDQRLVTGRARLSGQFLLPFRRATGQASNSPIVALVIHLANARQADSDPGRSPAG